MRVMPHDTVTFTLISPDGKPLKLRDMTLPTPTYLPGTWVFDSEKNAFVDISRKGGCR